MSKRNKRGRSITNWLQLWPLHQAIRSWLVQFSSFAIKNQFGIYFWDANVENRKTKRENTKRNHQRRIEMTRATTMTTTAQRMRIRAKWRDVNLEGACLIPNKRAEDFAQESAHFWFSFNSVIHSLNIVCGLCSCFRMKAICSELFRPYFTKHSLAHPYIYLSLSL